MLASERGQIPNGIRMREVTKRAIHSHEASLLQYDKSKKGKNHDVGPSDAQNPNSSLEFSSNQQRLYNISLRITAFPLNSPYHSLSLSASTPRITRMQAPRLLDDPLNAEDSDHHGHRTHTSVLFLSMSLESLLTFRTASRCKHAARLSTIELG